jgi:hypothetical protein
LERGAEIVMQAQYVAAKQSDPFPMKLSSRRGAAQCRKSLARTPLHPTELKQNLGAWETILLA